MSPAFPVRLNLTRRSNFSFASDALSIANPRGGNIFKKDADAVPLLDMRSYLIDAAEKRLSKNLIWVALGGNFTLIHNDKVVAKPGGMIKIMNCQDNRHAFGREPAQQRKQLQLGFDVEVAGWLVE